MTKTEVKRICKELLNKYPIDRTLGYARISNSGEHMFLIDLFKNHPDWKQKRGCGIEFISIIETTWRNNCFQIHRIDGTTTDISYISCLTKKTPQRIFVEACRNAIRKEIHKFRCENVIYGVTTCEITGEILTKENTHIDHYDLTFREIVKSFYQKYLSEYPIEFIVQNFINETTDNNDETKFLMHIDYMEHQKLVNILDYKVDGFQLNLESSFIHYHNQNTHLRAVTKEANLSILR